MKYKKINLFDVILGLIILTANAILIWKGGYKMNEVFETVAEVLRNLEAKQKNESILFTQTNRKMQIKH